MAEGEFNRLAARERGNTRVTRFAPDFLSYLAAADLSLSMAGYNTCMDILSTSVPALVWPFPQNREQGLRADRFGAQGWLTRLADRDLRAGSLAEHMTRVLSAGRVTSGRRPDLDGATNTARHVATGIAPMGRG